MSMKLKIKIKILKICTEAKMNLSKGTNVE
jgi:hypothetical protein